MKSTFEIVVAPRRGLGGTMEQQTQQQELKQAAIDPVKWFEGWQKEQRRAAQREWRARQKRKEQRRAVQRAWLERQGKGA